MDGVPDPVRSAAVLQVSDVKRSEAFYTEGLGFRSRGTGATHKVLTLIRQPVWTRVSQSVHERRSPRLSGCQPRLALAEIDVELPMGGVQQNARHLFSMVPNHAKRQPPPE